MSYANLEKRIGQVLYKMLEPSFVIEDDQLKILLDYLFGKENDFGGTGTPRLTESFFLPWMKRFTDSWNHSRYIIKTNLLLFAADLTIAMCSNENFFVRLNFSDVLRDFVELLRAVPEPETVVEVKMKYVEVMRSLLAHKCGLQWAMANRFWFDVFTMISRTKDEELRESSCDFVVDLLEKSKNENEKLCFNIFQTVMAPLNDLAQTQQRLRPDALIPMDGLLLNLDFLQLFLDALFKRSCSNNDLKSAQYLLAKFELEAQLEKLLLSVKNIQLAYELYKLLITVCMIELAVNLIERKPQPYYRRVTEKLIDSIIDLIKQFGGERFLKIIYRNHYYFKWISMMAVDVDVDYDFLFQLLMYNVLPMYQYVFKILEIERFDDDDECRELFVTKLIRKTDSNTFQVLFKMMKSGLTFDAEDAILALKYTAKCSELYNNEVANLATQMLIYQVVDISRHLRDHPKKLIDPKTQEVMSAYLDTIMIMVERFDLNWKDNIEVIYVTDIASEILSYDFLSTTAVVKGLELLNVAISKSLSPNMALLIDNASDTEINFVQIVFEKLQDFDPEVRRSAVRVVKTMCGKAKKNFDSYRKLLIDKDFPSVVFKMATSDKKSIVTVAALQCLQEMIEVDEFWEELLNQDCYYENLLKMVYFHPDESARSESISLLSLMCTSKPPLEPHRSKINESIVYSVMKDSSPTVKRKGLGFWHEAIRGELASHGAIDGHFPEATFSKRLRKIVTFGEAEIRRCLEAVLDGLAESGCLAAFAYASNSEDEAVRGEARRLLGPFSTLLARHFPVRTESDDRKKKIIRDFLEIVSKADSFAPDNCRKSIDFNGYTHVSSVLTRIFEQQNETEPRNDEISIMELTGG